VFIIVELGSRRMVHSGVTRHPTDEWIAQQLPEATPFGEKRQFLIPNNDRRYGVSFDRVAALQPRQATSGDRAADPMSTRAARNTVGQREASVSPGAERFTPRLQLAGLTKRVLQLISGQRMRVFDHDRGELDR
jgi:hypothetical protein